jgi:hypothetical protein
LRPSFFEPPLITYYATTTFISSSDAAAGGEMEYRGTRGHQETTVTLRSLSDWTTLATSTGATSKSVPFPGNFGLITDAIVGYWGTCGHFFEGNSMHRAEVRFSVSSS